jgi:hypothetical protein
MRPRICDRLFAFVPISGTTRQARSRHYLNGRSQQAIFVASSHASTPATCSPAGRKTCVPRLFRRPTEAAPNPATCLGLTFSSAVLRPAPTLQIKIRDFPVGLREICKHCAGLVGARPTPQRTPDRNARRFGVARCPEFLENCSPREA